MNLDPIVQPTEDEIREAAYEGWEARGREDGFDIEDWVLAEELSFLKKNYDVAVKYDFTTPTKVGKSAEHTCRFCGLTRPDVSFSKKAHALPEFLGNKAIISYDECDSCNSYFSGSLESDFANMTLLSRALTNTKGKNGSVVFETGKGRSRVEGRGSSIQVQDIQSNRITKISEQADAVLFECQTGSFTPIAVFKCLAKMAISVIPTECLPLFKSTASWVRNPDHTANPLNTHNLACYFTAVPGDVSHFPGSVMLLRRRKKFAPLPFMLFQVAFRNQAFQIAVPLSGVDIHLGEQVEIPPIPHWRTFSATFGPPVRTILSLSRTDKVRATFNLELKS